ncbi:MAG: hypothetical protein E7626_07220 [Ruminococcaceae bacterium]|nr:hypothetical protein [Oscillospiraceae bacterium]
MKEFFGFGGYQRSAEGYFSWQHIVFVTSLITVMTALAIIIGIKNKNADTITKNKVIIWSAILIDSFEIFKIIMVCLRSSDPMGWIYDLPLFLCSIQLITIPLAAFTKGRTKESALDFVLIFGLLGAFFGTYFAGNNYSSYPVLSFDNVVSGITHCISGFTAIYIGITGMANMKKRNLPITFSILLGFCTAALIVNKIIDYNYMFLVRGDGTPYDILYNIVGGNQILYPAGVILMFLIYISAFYLITFMIKSKKRVKETV